MIKMNKVRHLNNNNIEENTILKVQNSYLELKIFKKIKDRVSVFFFFLSVPKVSMEKSTKLTFFAIKGALFS